eukprot:8542017-Heterocapsa_arctica.AAC.1
MPASAQLMRPVRPAHARHRKTVSSPSKIAHWDHGSNVTGTVPSVGCLTGGRCPRSECPSGAQPSC